MKNKDHQAFINRLDEALENKKTSLKVTRITRDEIGKHAGNIKGVSVTQWYKDGNWPKVANVVKLCKWLGVSVEWLLTGNGARNPKEAARKLSPDEDRLLQYMAFLDKDRQAKLLDYASDLVSISANKQEVLDLLNQALEGKHSKVRKKTRAKT